MRSGLGRCLEPPGCGSPTPRSTRLLRHPRTRPEPLRTTGPGHSGIAIAKTLVEIKAKHTEVKTNIHTSKCKNIHKYKKIQKDNTRLGTQLTTYKMNQKYMITNAILAAMPHIYIHGLTRQVPDPLNSSVQQLFPSSSKSSPCPRNSQNE